MATPSLGRRASLERKVILGKKEESRRRGEREKGEEGCLRMGLILREKIFKDRRKS